MRLGSAAARRAHPDELSDGRRVPTLARHPAITRGGVDVMCTAIVVSAPVVSPVRRLLATAHKCKSAGYPTRIIERRSERHCIVAPTVGGMSHAATHDFQRPSETGDERGGR